MADHTPGISERRGSTSTFHHGGIKSQDAQSVGSALASTRQYDAFGQVVSSTGTWSGPFGHAGGFGYQEDATGLQLLGHRYYDPSTGRFLTRDPIKDGRNWYAYGAGSASPLAGVDPSGLRLGGISNQLPVNDPRYVVLGGVWDPVTGFISWDQVLPGTSTNILVDYDCVLVIDTKTGMMHLIKIGGATVAVIKLDGSGSLVIDTDSRLPDIIDPRDSLTEVGLRERYPKQPNTGADIINSVPLGQRPRFIRFPDGKIGTGHRLR